MVVEGSGVVRQFGSREERERRRITWTQLELGCIFILSEFIPRSSFVSRHVSDKVVETVDDEEEYERIKLVYYLPSIKVIMIIIRRHSLALFRTRSLTSLMSRARFNSNKTTTIEDHDIISIGGGPVGLALAAALGYSSQPILLTPITRLMLS